MDQSMTSALTVIAVLFVIFLVGREIICWYWKINRSVELMEEILQELKKLNGSTSAQEEVARK